MFIFVLSIVVVTLTVWSVKKQFNQFDQFIILFFINFVLVICFGVYGPTPINYYLTFHIPRINILIIIPIFLSTRFLCSRFIFKNLVKTKQSSARIISRNPQQFGESELISFIDKIKEREFPKASISKSSISGDYVIVKDLKGVVLSQIKISEIDKY